MGGSLRSRLLTEILPHLRCPACACRLQELNEGVICSCCQKRFPLVRGVLRFADSGNYVDSFGYQWQKFSRTQLRPAFCERNLRRKSALTESDVRGKLVLDIGCGMGRFAEVVTRWGGRVVGVDLSAAAEVAAENLGGCAFLAIQADVFSLPFAPGIFDCIYSVGVLHHTPDCEKAFKILPRYLKPGGSIAIWVYSGYNKWYRFSDHYRKVTSRISPRRLHSLLRVIVPCLYWTNRIIRAIPLIGPPVAGLLHHVFPVNQNPDPEIRILDTLDWYSPRYQSKHTYEQVFRWFESCGLENITVAGMSIGVKGYAPAHVESFGEDVYEMRPGSVGFRGSPNL
jgi:SAM-dependent methyltransferase